MIDKLDCERLERPPVLLFRLGEQQCRQIDAWANALIHRLGCRLIAREQGADRLAWLLEVEGCHLLLQHERYSESTWLELIRAADEALLERLHQKLIKSSCEKE